MIINKRIKNISGDWGLGPITNPQSPNKQYKKNIKKNSIKKIGLIIYFF